MSSRRDFRAVAHCVVGASRNRGWCTTRGTPMTHPTGRSTRVRRSGSALPLTLPQQWPDWLLIGLAGSVFALLTAVETSTTSQPILAPTRAPTMAPSSFCLTEGRPPASAGDRECPTPPTRFLSPWVPHVYQPFWILFDQLLLERCPRWYPAPQTLLDHTVPLSRPTFAQAWVDKGSIFWEHLWPFTAHLRIPPPSNYIFYNFFIILHHPRSLQVRCCW